MNTRVFISALGAMALGALGGLSYAQDASLSVHHFVSPKAPPHAKFLEPWAKKVMEESDGRINIEIFPSMTLGGKPPELYSQARDGAADIVWTVTGYTPGVFPRSEVFELPTVHTGSAVETTKSIYENWDLIKDDFSDIKPLAIYVHAGQAFHLTDGCVDGPADLQGQKIRIPSRTGGWMIEALGAEPVGMPLPAFPQALSKNAVDAGMLPFEIVPPYKVHELTNCSVAGQDGQRFGTAVFMLAMNKDKYNALPDDLKAVIDANSGENLALFAADIWDNIEAGGINAVKKVSEYKELSAKATQDMLDAVASVEKRWVDEVTAAGHDGAALVNAAKAGVAQASQ